MSRADKHREASSTGSVQQPTEGISPMKAKEAVREIFGDPECGQVFRIKGFLKDENVWQELNATVHELTMHPLEAGQDVLIVIGEQMNEEKIRGYLKK